MSIITDFLSEDLSSLIEKDSNKLFDSVEGLSTGFPELDRLSRGLLPQHSYLLGSETGVGKSVFAINILVNIALSDSAKSLYIDLENGSMATYKRFLMIAGNKNSQFFDDKVNLQEVSKITANFKDKIFYQDRISLESYLKGNTSLDEAKALGVLIEDFVIKHEVKVVVVDPLEEFEVVTNDPTASYTAIQQVVSFFRDLAQKHYISIILIHHLRKPSAESQQVKNFDEDITPKYRIPSIHDFIGSSKIVNVCTDVWCFVRQIHAPYPFEQGKTLFRILKARETALGDIRFQMDVDTLRFHGRNLEDIEQEKIIAEMTHQVDPITQVRQDEKAKYEQKIIELKKENKQKLDKVALDTAKQVYGLKKEEDKLADWIKRSEGSEEGRDITGDDVKSQKRLGLA